MRFVCPALGQAATRAGTSVLPRNRVADRLRPTAARVVAWANAGSGVDGYQPRLRIECGGFRGGSVSGDNWRRARKRLFQLSAGHVVGPLGAGLVAGSIFLLALCGLGSFERKRWNGNVPTIAEYMSNPTRRTRKSSIMQLKVATFGRRALLTAFAGLGVGLILVIAAAIR